MITPWVSVKQEGTSLSFLEGVDDILEGEGVVVARVVVVRIVVYLPKVPGWFAGC